MTRSNAQRRGLGAWLLLVALFISIGAAAEVRTVRVGIYANAPKLEMGANNLPSGILGELLQEIARLEGWTLHAVPCQWQACLELLQAGQIDLLPDVAYSAARAQWMDFHQHASLFSWSALYSREKLHYATIEDFADLRIAVLKGSIQATYLKDIFQYSEADPYLVEVDSLQQGFDAAAEGEVDAAVANNQFGDRFAGDYDLQARPLMLPPVRMFYATQKEHNRDLLMAIDRHLEGWLEDSNSVYHQIMRRWSGEHLPELIPRYVYWSLALLGGLLLLALAFGLLLRRQVAEKTRHLKASEARLNAILDHVGAAIYIKDPQLRYQYANPMACEMLGKPLQQVLGQTDAQILGSQTLMAAQDADRRVILLGERVQSEETQRHPADNSEHTYLSIKLPLHDAHGQIYALCGIATDISEQRRHQEQIIQLAFYDPLTNLPNRRLLRDRLEQALAKRERGQPSALLFIDLDNFKDLNDSVGHDVGDLLLQQVAERLSEHLRAQDTLARQGGDEFVLLIEGPGAPPAEFSLQVEAIAGKVIAALAEPYQLQGFSHLITASIGITFFPQPPASVDEMLKRADLAMYQAKAAGRNCVRYFDPLMQAEVNARATLAREIREGLNSEQFVLYLQPQLNQAGQVIGAEVLIRWQHPSRGLIYPGEFIHMAESTGLILPMGQWMLRQVCVQLAAWADDPELSRLTLAINISARQFHHPNFVSEVLAALEQSGAQPARLELELTESLLAEDIDELIGKMTGLREHGLRLSLDDFGTGYSSLNYLKRLPLDQLKIDQSFVRELLDHPRDAAIVRTILALGSNLGLEVIAEGVETDSQWRKLLQMGCHQFQGYFFARAMPMESFAQWARQASTAPRAQPCPLLSQY